MPSSSLIHTAAHAQPLRGSGPATPRRIVMLLVALAVMACPLAMAPSPALADHSQTTFLEDDALMLDNPGNTLGFASNLGVSETRLALRWQSIAPDPNSFRAPKHFNAANPASYSKSKWARYDNVVRAAKQRGDVVDMDLLGGAPLWATGGGMPRGIGGYPFHNWKPSASAFGKFVRAVATRYSGNYNPNTKRLDPGNSADLPRVNFWSVWNEPNYGPSLAPQSMPGNKNLPYSPRTYRSIVDQTFSALKATGHGSDKLLFGELAPRGYVGYGTFNMMAPLIFMRGLYCLSGSYHYLRGKSATDLGCPTTRSGSARFVAHNPALFRAAGVSDHPYMRWFPPNQERDQAQPKHFRALKPNYSSLATIGNLERGLNRMLGAYRWRRKMPVWITEFGYITNPPAKHYPSPGVAAAYDNWAEYIAWRDPRIASFDQYILRDLPGHGSHTGFASGLINANGTHKAGYDAFRMPIYLPHTTSSGPKSTLEVWGAARPVHMVMMAQPGVAQTVNIRFKPSGSHSFETLATEPVSSSQGYFDARIAFPSSGTVKLAYTYPSGSLLAPPGTTVYSRTVNVKVR